MKNKYIQYFPKPLLADLITGAWLPVVGAGLSRNATVPIGKAMPLWDDLGRDFANEMTDYPYSGALDAISAYCHEYARPKLVERLSEALLIKDARPSEAHRAFCSIPFDIVCTTNFDFLLERQYELSPRYCRPIIDEEQLSVNTHKSGITLLKLHGDVHHPQRLVVTEEDYDQFLDKYPLLATYLANLLITRTAVFIGYSLDDPDFRQIWQVVGERLGKSRRLAYAVLVDARPTDIARFERRGVKVISLPGERSKYARILAEAFDELREYLQTNLIPASQVTEEDPLKELSLPREALTRLCFFAVPLKLQSFYKEYVFPIVETHGFIPLTADDVVSPGDNFMAKVDALIERSLLVVVDASSPNTLAEMRLATAKSKELQMLIVLEENGTVPFDIGVRSVIWRSSTPFQSPESFLEEVNLWFERAARQFGPRLAGEPQRLFALGEYRSAVIAAITLLETSLRTRLQKPTQSSPNLKASSLSRLIHLAQEFNILNEETARLVTGWLRIRNTAVHQQTNISRKQAREIVEGVDELVREMDIIY